MAKSPSRVIKGGEPQVLRLEDLSGGVDLRHSPTLMQPNRSRALRNFSLKEPGALSMTPGYDLFSTASLGAGRCQGGRRIYLSGSTFTLAAFGGSIYKPTDLGVWGSAVLAGRHATNPIAFVYDRDLVAALDASNVPQKSTDGSTWTQMGISVPATAPTASAVNNGGTLVDVHTYEFSYAYKDDGLVFIGNESATVQQAMATPNLTARVHVTASGDAQVDKIVIYARDVTAGEAARRVAKTVANSTADIDITSNDWSARDEAYIDHSVPPALSFGVCWKYRWWCKDATVKNRLRFSQIYSPQAWPGTYYLDIPFDRGDEIAAIAAQGDTLIVFGQASKPFLIIGQTSLDFEVRPAFGAIAGAVGDRAVAVIENGVVHAASSGVYLFDGASDKLLSYDIEDAWRDIMANATATNIARIAMTYHEPRKELRIAVSRLYPAGTPGEWILDLNRTRLQETPAWTATTRTIGDYISWDGTETTTGNTGRLFSCNLTTGQIYEEATGTSANGSDQTAEYEGPTLTMGMQVARFIEGWVEFKPAAGTLSFSAVVDGADQGSQNITITSSLSAYGTAAYGSSTYGGKDRETKHVMLPLAAQGRTIQPKYTYVGQGDFKLYTHSFGVVPEVTPRLM